MYLLSKKMLLERFEGDSGFELFYEQWSLGFLFTCALVAHTCLLGLVAETWGLSLLLQCM